MSIKSKPDLFRFLDNVFLVLSGIYMAFMVYTMSMFQWEVPVIAKIVLLGLMLIVAGVRVLLIGLKNLKVWIGVAICAVYSGVFYVSDNSNFLFLAACTIGYLEIDYRKIIRTYLIAVGTALSIVVIAAMAGWIENLTFNKDAHIRYSMGTIYPTDFASLILFLLLYLWVALKKVPDWVLLVLPVISFVIAWRVTYSVTSMVCSVLFAVIILYHVLDQRVLVKRPRLRAASDWATMLATVVVAGIVVALLFWFERENTWIQQLDELLTHRLYYANKGLRTYGLHPFGSSFELLGAGRTDGEWYASYNFIDCSFHLIFIRYGYIMLVAVLTIWVYEIRAAQNVADRRLAFVLALIAFHSCSEHHLIEMHYNIAISMPLAMYGGIKLSEQVLDKTVALQN